MGVLTVAARNGVFKVTAAYALVALSWAGAFTAGKVGVAEAPPAELSALRFLIAGGILVVVCRAVGIDLPIRRPVPVIAVAFFGVFLYNVVTFYGLTMSPASDAALIVPTTIPIITAVLATLIGERLTGGRVGGLLVASVGAALVIGGGSARGGEVDMERLTGDLLALMGAVALAASTVVSRVALRERRPLALVAQSSLLGGLMLLPAGLLEEGYRDLPGWSAGAWFAVAYLAVGATVVGFGAYYWAVERFGAGRASLVTYLVPIASLVIAGVVLGERPEPVQLVGGAIILFGVRLATRPAAGR